MMIKYKFLFLFFVSVLFFGCRKNTSGSGGKAQINGYLLYQGTGYLQYQNNRVTKNAVVYIKYGASTFPGTDVSQYDSQQNTDSQGNFVFGTLFEGDYYLYATGSYILPYGFIQNVSGGIHVTITTRKVTLNYDIPLQ